MPFLYFSLQSSQALSDPRWGTWIDLILVCSWQVLSDVLAGGAWEGSRLWNKEPNINHVVF